MIALGPYLLNYRADHEEGILYLKHAVTNIEEGSPVRRIATVGLFLFALVVTARARQRGADPLDPPRGQDRWIAFPIVAFGLLAAASVAWTQDPMFVLKRVVIFSTLGFGAWAVGRAWRFSDILLFTILSCGAIVGSSLVLEIARGVFHPADPVYRLEGLAQPNTHAVEAVMVILASLAAARLEPEHRVRYLLAAAGGSVTLFLTHSRTAELSLLVALGCGAFYTMPRRQIVALALPVLAAACIIALWGTDVLDVVRHTLVMGRAQSTAQLTTLTGRTQLWAELLTYARNRPMLGYGFGAFWNAGNSADVSLAVNWVVPNAHDAYLDVVLGLGVVGLMLFVTAFVAGVAHAVRQLRANRDSVEALFTLCLLAWVMTAMVTESIIPVTHFMTLIPMIFLAREATTAPATVVRRVYAPAMSYTV